MGKAATATTTTASRARGGRPLGTGGRRLAAAFASASRLPALAEARLRLLRLTEREGASTGDVADALESDAGLAIAVLRAANNGDGPAGRVGGVREAVEALSPQRVGVIAAQIESYDVFDRPGLWSEAHERFRRHAVATRQAADRVAELARLGKRDELAVAALLHDVGRLVLADLYGSELEGDAREETSEERVRRERRELGIDHALVGAVLIRRWGLRPTIASAVERHHAADARDHAAALQLADAIAHYADGDRVPPESLLRAARQLGLDETKLRSLLYEFPYAGEPRRRATDPCPLSMREIDALRGLAEGKVYKQIAQELHLSVSTIRTHLHNVYRKIGAVDRAQAVLLARDRGWI